MNYLKHMPVGQKLVLAFTIMILLTMAVGLVGYRSAGRMAGNIGDIFTVRLPAIDALIEADRDLQQLLVAERSLLMAEPGSELFKKLMASYEENLEQASTRFGKYKALAASKEETGPISEHEKARETWKPLSRKVVDLAAKGTPESRAEALALSFGQAKQAFEEMREHINGLTELSLKQAEEINNNAKTTYGALRTWIFTITALGILVGIILIIWLTTGITRPLRRAISGIMQGANQVSGASTQISESAQSLASGSSEQAASIEEISSSLEEISSMTRRSAENSHQADALTGETKKIMGQALEAMGDLTASMGEITKASEETSKIVKTIDEIAFQTNLLALNAAVEAARAGEAGAGFAVVADEVRSLAMRAASAAKNTSDLIEGTVKKIHAGAGLSSSAVQIFRNVSESTDRLGTLVGEVAGAAHEQAKGVEQVNTAVQEMNTVTQQNAATAEESASASEEMNAQAEQMKGLVRELEVLVDGGRQAGRISTEAPAPKFDSRKPVLKRPPSLQKKLAPPAGRGQAAKTRAVDDAFEDF